MNSPSRCLKVLSLLLVGTPLVKVRLIPVCMSDENSHVIPCLDLSPGLDTLLIRITLLMLNNVPMPEAAHS